MKVLLLSGSVGKESCTRALLKYVEEALIERGIETVWWDLSERPLPIAVPEYHSSQHKHPVKLVREFTKVAKEVDGYVLGSPLYHDSFSGVLKNALDNLSNEAFLYKPVGLVSHSSNVRSCVVPCNQLRPVVRSLGGYATHSQIGTTDQDYEVKLKQLKLVNPKVIERVNALVEELISMSSKLKE